MAMARDVRSDKARLTFQLIKKDRDSDDNRPLMYACILGDNAVEKWSRFYRRLQFRPSPFRYDIYTAPTRIFENAPMARRRAVEFDTAIGWVGGT